MQRRLLTARAEVAAFAEYDYVVVNDELETCVDRLRAIVLAERARSGAPAARPSGYWRRFTRKDDRMTEKTQIPNKFEFVIVAGARARQLLAGCTPKATGTDKLVRLAQQEVREGKVRNCRLQIEECRLTDWRFTD